MFFLTSYANVNGEQMHFKLYDAATGEIHALEEVMAFAPNLHQGSIENPIPFTLETTGTEDDEIRLYDFDVLPNPFRDATRSQFTLQRGQAVRLTISDMNGVLVFAAEGMYAAGMHAIGWDGHSVSGAPMVNGMYVIRLETDEGITTRKVVLNR